MLELERDLNHSERIIHGNVYLESYQISKMVLVAKIVDDFYGNLEKRLRVKAYLMY